MTGRGWLRWGVALGWAMGWLALVQLGLAAGGPAVAEAAVDVPAPAVASPLTDTTVYTTYLPLVLRAPTAPPVQHEARAVWVSRYDWTRFGVAPTPADIQQVVDQAVSAGFNALFFQVRGAGDAYYTPGREPWAARMTGSLGWTLGQDPGWDPLAELCTRAHAAGLTVHAWLNVYPTWQAPPTATYGTLTPTLGITPPQALNRLTYSADGGYGLGYTWRVYDRPASNGYQPIRWNEYTWASPAVPQVQEHFAAIVADLVARYDLDGIHLDNVRYPGPQYSWDPFTLAAYAADPLSATMTITDWRPGFQQAQVTALVARVTMATHTTRPTLTISAAVWPVYLNRWGWPATSEGLTDYYQDSQGWLQSGAVDALAPMLYSSNVVTDLTKWTLAAQDFQTHAAGRVVLPGIGVTAGGTCLPFAELASRIEAARSLGAAGQAVFSLSALADCGYLDDLRAGPYATPAVWP